MTIKPAAESRASSSHTAFAGSRRLVAGPPHQVALAARKASEDLASGPILVFDDATGRVVDLDLRGTEAERASDEPNLEARGPGRPKLGVVAREVTLLPHHWEWLATQPGGASATLRRLVHEASRSDGARRRRSAQERAYRFMVAVAGDLPGFEEATRALFADDLVRFEKHMGEWPADLRNYAIALASKNEGQS